MLHLALWIKNNKGLEYKQANIKVFLIGYTEAVSALAYTPSKIFNIFI